MGNTSTASCCLHFSVYICQQAIHLHEVRYTAHPSSFKMGISSKMAVHCLKAVC